MDNISGVPYDDERIDVDGNYYNGKISGEDNARRCMNPECRKPIYYGLACSNLCAEATESNEGMIAFLIADRNHHLLEAQRHEMNYKLLVERLKVEKTKREQAEMKLASVQAAGDEVQAINRMMRSTIALLEGSASLAWRTQSPILRGQ